MNFLKNICLSLIKTSITIKTFKLLPIVTTFLMAFFCMNAFSTEDGTCEKAISNENTEETKNIEETTVELQKDNDTPIEIAEVHVDEKPADQNDPNNQYDINLESKTVEEAAQNDESIIPDDYRFKYTEMPSYLKPLLVWGAPALVNSTFAFLSVFMFDYYLNNPQFIMHPSTLINIGLYAFTATRVYETWNISKKVEKYEKIKKSKTKQKNTKTE